MRKIGIDVVHNTVKALLFIVAACGVCCLCFVIALLSRIAREGASRPLEISSSDNQLYSAELLKLGFENPKFKNGVTGGGRGFVVYRAEFKGCIVSLVKKSTVSKWQYLPTVESVDPNNLEEDSYRVGKCPKR